MATGGLSEIDVYLEDDQFVGDSIRTNPPVVKENRVKTNTSSKYTRRKSEETSRYQRRMPKTVNRLVDRESEQYDEDEKNELFAISEHAQAYLSDLTEYIDRHGEDPDKLLATISETDFGFHHFLSNKPLSHEECFIVAEIVSISCQANSNILLRHLMHSIVETEFIATLDNCLNVVAMKMETHPFIWKNSDRLSKFCLMTIDILNHLMIFNKGSLEKYKRIVGSLKSVIAEHDLNQVTQIETELALAENNFKELKLIHHRLIEKKNEPPDDFRSIDIFPSPCELHGKKQPFLRKNITEGRHEDLQSYLDIHFRLLREDYVGQFRTGIMKFRRQIKSKAPKERIREIRLYQDVQMAYPDFQVSGVTHYFSFQGKRMKKASKGILTGSLLCISADKFETFVYATVTDANKIEANLVGVHLERDAISILQRNRTYMMAEATAFFAPYRHVLFCLQGLTELPFQQYILFNDTDMKPPAYLKADERPSYDFACLTRCEEQCTNQTLRKWNLLRRPSIVCQVLDTDCWPAAKVLGFDVSQYKAIQAAITNELAIIQGPPGTGKTYIGLKIAELLSENMAKYKETGPILVVCYTNHALDQFLEGVYSFCPRGITRLGGRSKSEILYRSTYRRKHGRSDYFSQELQMAASDHSLSIRACKESLQEWSKLLKESYEEILPLHHLIEYMTPEQKMSFYNENVNRDAKFTEWWLGVTIDYLDLSLFGNDKYYAMTFFSWVQYIAELTVQRRPFNVSAMDDLWMLKLDDRARLYRYWVSEVSNAIDMHVKDLLSTGNHRQKLTEIRDLENTLITMNTKVTSATLLLSHVTNIDTWNEIFSLRLDDKSIDESLFHWLCLDGFPETIDMARAALQSIRKYELQTVDESRYVDNDDETSDFLHLGNEKMESNDWCYRINKRRRLLPYRYLSQRCSVDYIVNAKTDVNNLTYIERFLLYKSWITKLRNTLRSKLQEHEKEFIRFSERTATLENQKMVENLQNEKFIGMTTTKAAQLCSVLQDIAPKIIMVEEAAEVLEAHILSSLNSRCQHLILIGDHKQLRPSTTVYELSKRYKLDVSLFERLVQNGIPCVTLTEQHRMRPEISKLMRHQNLYPNLKDHAIVKSYGNVKGISKNVVFLNHVFPEAMNEGTLSYTNEYEAEFIETFTKYILQQGYEEKDITVIAPYVGQVLKIRNILNMKRQSDVNVTTIDNYQGEENAIVILSLVRSKPYVEGTERASIGFVGIENRICVSLSRAKIGMYVIGNFDHLRANSTMWDFMVQQVDADGNLLDKIPLQCQNHPDTITNVSLPEDFQLVPNGGCNTQCEFVLSCEHQCQKKCHLSNTTHTNYCLLPCSKICSRGHKCKFKCSAFCDCTVKVEKTFSQCGHITTLPCNQFDRAPCKDVCNANLSCGHYCKRVCNECNQMCKIRSDCTEQVEFSLSCGHIVTANCSANPNAIKCRHQVTKTLPCTHEQTMECHVDENTYKCKTFVLKSLPCDHELQLNCYADPRKEQCKHKVQKTLPCGHVIETICWMKDGQMKCPHSCKKKLACGHLCGGSCEECFHGRIHKGCNDACQKRLICGHYCSFPCSIVCPQCSRKCLKVCGHGTCGKVCFQSCDDCHKKCSHKCSHWKCQHLCFENCTGNICDESCKKELKCKHVCVGLCGETCVCIRCSWKHDKRNVEYNRSNRYMKLPDCSCIFDVKQLDQYMFDDKNENELFKHCPYEDCGKIIKTDIKRYTNVLKKCNTNLNSLTEKAMSGKHKLSKSILSDLKYLKQRLPEKLSEQLSKESVDIKTQIDVEQLKTKTDLLLKLCPKRADYTLSSSKVFSIPELAKKVLDRKRLTHQFVKDIERELFRIKALIRVVKHWNAIYIQTGVSNTLTELQDLITKPARITHQDKGQILKTLHEIDESERCHFCKECDTTPNDELTKRAGGLLMIEEDYTEEGDERPNDQLAQAPGGLPIIEEDHTEERYERPNDELAQAPGGLLIIEEDHTTERDERRPNNELAQAPGGLPIIEEDHTEERDERPNNELAQAPGGLPIIEEDHTEERDERPNDELAQAPGGLPIIEEDHTEERDERPRDEFAQAACGLPMIEEDHTTYKDLMVLDFTYIDRVKISFASSMQELKCINERNLMLPDAADSTKTKYTFVRESNVFSCMKAADKHLYNRQLSIVSKRVGNLVQTSDSDRRLQNATDTAPRRMLESWRDRENGSGSSRRGFGSLSRLRGSRAENKAMVSESRQQPARGFGGSRSRGRGGRFRGGRSRGRGFRRRGLF